MARRKQNNLDETLEALGPGAGHNLTDEVISREMGSVLTAWRSLQEKKKEMQAANGLYRKCIKDAKARGLNNTAILRVIGRLEQDPEDTTQLIKDELRYYGVLGIPVGQQMEMFPPSEGFSTPEVSAREQGRRKRANGSARKRGKVKSNPFPTGSEQAREFDAGWDEGIG